MAIHNVRSAAIKKIRYMSMNADLDKFFATLDEGELFRYSDCYILPEVKKMGERRGVTVEYCPPGTPEYKTYGCFTVRVIRNKILIPETNIFHFDPEYLNI